MKINTAQLNTTFIRYIILLIAVLSLFIIGVWFAWTRRYSLTTNDAFVHAHVVAIAPQEIKGRVIGVYVSDYATVRKGQKLFQIDPRVYQAAYNQSLANLQMTKDQINYLYDQVKNARLSIEIAQANLALRKKHYLEKLPLAQKGYVTKFDLQALEENYLAAQGKLKEAQANLAAAEENLGSMVNGKNVRLLAAEAEVIIAKRHLDETTVYAPASGYIVNSSLRVGDYLNTGQSELSLVDTSTWQIYAFYQETAAGRLYIGEKVRVKLMMYPNIKTYGKIIAIERGSSREPSTLGANNLRYIQPEEEWILLPQRFLVYIDFAWPHPNKPLQVGATSYVTALPNG